MKSRLVSWFVGSAVMLGSTAMALSIQPMAQAQMPMMQTVLENLELTEAQQQQVSEIRQSTRSQIGDILTPEQRSQLQAVVLEGADLQEGVAAMNITEQQREDIRGIVQSARGDLQGLLTDEQRSTLRQTLRAQWRQSGWGNRQ